MIKAKFNRNFYRRFKMSKDTSMKASRRLYKLLGKLQYTKKASRKLKLLEVFGKVWKVLGVICPEQLVLN